LRRSRYVSRGSRCECVPDAPVASLNRAAEVQAVLRGSSCFGLIGGVRGIPHRGFDRRLDRTTGSGIFGAHLVHLESAARKRLQRIDALSFGRLPICIAKTQSSLSDNPKLLGAPRDWMLTVTDAHLAAGAGLFVVLAGNMLLMPGLSKNPQAMVLDVDEGGQIIGLD